ncbi:MAG: phosphoglucosamine mutase [Saprospiraceae bacterium]|nr:phosphoglucosamine mutase [Saprospiraceae bacterium]
MSLIKSISGIRGTIGGVSGDNLTPIDVVNFTSSYGNWILSFQTENPKVVIGRDARISGEIVQSLVVNTLISMGIDVIDVGLSTTPTVEMMVPKFNANGGIIVTASHNPSQWNALKFLNDKGEFISDEVGKGILTTDPNEINFVTVDKLGKISYYQDAIQDHIDAILKLDYLVDLQKIKDRNFKVVIDVINSTGAISMVPLLKQLNCEVLVINGDMNGNFAHNPEPLPEHLNEIKKAVTTSKSDLGIVVDPDVDRIAFVCEDGEFFGEEYSLVAISDFVLNHKKGATVSNLSSTKALKDVTEKHGCQYFAAAVGEVNVVEKMKAVNAVIGGEGNGGIIFPELHYGRDALLGAALFLSSLAQFGKTTSFYRSKFPNYNMVKSKITLPDDVNLDQVLIGLKSKYQMQPINTIDGLKIEFDNDWIHLRKSNTEPIIRVYAESYSETTANNLIQKIISDINLIIKELN